MRTRGSVVGTLAMAGVNVVKLGMQLAVLPILARILGPSSFGLVALAMPFILLANMVSDFGLGNALVRHKDSSRELESTIFWFSLLMSSALAGVVALLAWPAGWLLSAPRLPPILLALSLILPIGGSLSVVNARIARDRRFDIFAAGEFMASVASAAAAILAALEGMGPWSLVVQQFVLWGVKAIWLFPMSGFRLRLCCEPVLIQPHWGFGLNAAGANLADFGIKNVPTIIVGGLIGVAAAGHYAMAYQIIRVPELIISGPIYLSVFAAVARWGNNHSGAKPLVLKGLRGLVTALAPTFCGLAFISVLLVRLVFGPKWAATGPLLTLLTPAGFFLCLYGFAGAVLMGLGRSDRQLKLILLGGVSIGVGIAIGSHYGAEGIALGLSAGAACIAPAYIYVLSDQLLVSPRLIAGELAPPLIATAAMAVVLLALSLQIGGWPQWLQLAALVVSGSISFCAVLVTMSRRRLEEDLRWLLAAKAEPQAAP